MDYQVCALTCREFSKEYSQNMKIIKRWLIIVRLLASKYGMCTQVAKINTFYIKNRTGVPLCAAKKKNLHAHGCMCIYTFHCRTREFLVPLALRGGMGVSGSQLRVVKLAGSEGFPCKQLYTAWTLQVQMYTISPINWRNIEGHKWIP